MSMQRGKEEEESVMAILAPIFVGIAFFLISQLVFRKTLTKTTAIEDEGRYWCLV